jgi:hypothetical protein
MLIVTLVDTDDDDDDEAISVDIVVTTTDDGADVSRVGIGIGEVLSPIGVCTLVVETTCRTDCAVVLCIVAGSAGRLLGDVVKQVLGKPEQRQVVGQYREACK